MTGNILAGVMGGVGLLIVLGMINTGRLHIEQVCDLRRGANPAAFWALAAIITLVSMALIAVCFASIATLLVAGT